MVKLNRLGRNLMLVNLAVSGAVLIIMAAITLTIAENSISSQQTRDLAMYARSFQTLILPEADSTRGIRQGETIRAIPMPERYGIITDDEQLKVIAPSSAYISKEELAELEIVARVMISDNTIFAQGRREAYQSETNETTDIGARIPTPLFYIKTSLPFTWKTSGGAVVRVWAMSTDKNGEESVTMLLQDMREEMNERIKLRWLFGGLVMFGLCLIAVTSWLLSKRSIRPIQKSIKQQSAFVAAASHELRTPVTALQANAEVLRDAPLGGFGIYLNSIEEVSGRMTRLVGDMIDLARADAGELSLIIAPMDAREAAAEAIRWIMPLVERKGIIIAEDLAPAPMKGDPDRVKQILLALLDNAMRYTGEGGRIGIMTAADRKKAVITVSDNGIGIPDEHKTRVFERFYRMDGSRDTASGGTGLGLSIVAQLTEQMNGRVKISDTPGGGATITLEFPITPVPPSLRL